MHLPLYLLIALLTLTHGQIPSDCNVNALADCVTPLSPLIQSCGVSDLPCACSGFRKILACYTTHCPSELSNLPTDISKAEEMCIGVPEPSAPTNPAEPAETDGDGGSETEEEEEENEEAGEYTTTWTAEDGGATDTVTIPPGWAPGWGDEGPYGSYTPFSLRPTQSIQVPSGDDSDEDGNGNKIVTSEGPGGGLLDVLQRISQSASSSGGGGAGPTTTEGNGPSSTVSDDAAPTMGLEVGGMVAVAIGVVAVL